MKILCCLHANNVTKVCQALQCMQDPAANNPQPHPETLDTSIGFSMVMMPDYGMTGQQGATATLCATVHKLQHTAVCCLCMYKGFTLVMGAALKFIHRPEKEVSTYFVRSFNSAMRRRVHSIQGLRPLMCTT